MDTTTASINESIGYSQPLQPEWARIPDAIKFSGIGRSRLYQLFDSGEVLSVCLRDPQKVRGIRLINLKSLNDYISSFQGDKLSAITIGNPSLRNIQHILVSIS